LLQKFTTNYRISSDNSELIVPSIFREHDPKRHMSINMDTGLWRCFKTGNKGNFISLYSQMESIPYKKVYEKFLIESFLHNEQEELNSSGISLKPTCISKQDEDYHTFIPLELDQVPEDASISLAWVYLYDRGVWDFEGAERTFYVATEGFFKDRVIIPYNLPNNIKFFQGRALLYDIQPKYLNSRNMKMRSVLYPFKYDSTEPLYVCEGALDAITLQNCGLNATTTMSCHVSKEQMSQLKQYQGPIVVCYDNDRAGLNGIYEFNYARKWERISNLYVSVPPVGCKDWNEFYLSKTNRKPKLLQEAIRSNTVDCEKFEITLQLSALKEI